MRRVFHGTASLLCVAATVALAAWTYRQFDPKTEAAPESAEPEQPTGQVSHNELGETVVTLDPETQSTVGLQTTTLRGEHRQPSVTAYGALMEDPALSFTIKAPIAGTVTTRDSVRWPHLGQVLAPDAEIGTIEPRFTPVEQVDLTTRLIDARHTVEELTASAAAARESYEQKRELNTHGRLVAERTIEDAKAKMEGLEARLAGAKETVRLLEAARAATTQSTDLKILRAGRGGEVVEIMAGPGEIIDSGQPIMRVAHFDELLARVESPPGQTMPVTGAAAQLVVLGAEDKPMKAEWVGWAGTVDPKTRNRALLLRIGNHAGALRPGLAVKAYLPISGQRLDGVVVPSSAVVRYGDRSWVYVANGEDQFVRREIALKDRAGDGWFVTKNFAPGDRVVTTGAQVLVAEEMRGQGSGGGEE
jgi:multidrug efflux system membrane fusion protein